MTNQDNFMKPQGYITMVLHNGGSYDIKTNSFSDDANIIDTVEFPNLIVSNASILMASRMAPSITGHINVPTNTHYYSSGITHLALGVGASSTTVVTPSVNKLSNEVCRKKFDQWTFIDVNGNVSSSYPTNVLKFSTTFSNQPHIGSYAGEAVPLTEMGLFGGGISLDGNSTPINDIDGGTMFNYKVFDVWNKPMGSSLTIMWKITF